MGCGGFSKGSYDNKKSALEPRKSRIITKNEHSEPPVIPEPEISTSTGKEDSKKNKRTKEKSKKSKKEKTKAKKSSLPAKIKPPVPMYDISIRDVTNTDSPPLWTNKQKMGLEFPIYKFVIEKSIHKPEDPKKLSKKDNWQSTKLNASDDHSFAEKLLKLSKREWMSEYIQLMDSKISQNENTLSLQGLTVHRNLAQVYEQFNWIVWAVSHYYFENHMFESKTSFGLPPPDNDAWIDGFMWKGVYFRLIPALQAPLIKQEIEALKHISLELEEGFSLEENYRNKFRVNTSKSYHRSIITPLLSLSECGSFAIYGCPEIHILKTGSSNVNKGIQNLQSSLELDLSDSMLQLMPCLSKLTPANLVPINLQDYEDKLIILNSYKVMPAYHSDSYSKCIIRIPQDNNEEITIYSYPHKGSIPLSDLVCLFKDGKLDDPDASRNEETVRLERDNIREGNFYAHGCKMKILLYDSPGSQPKFNERAMAVFLTRDERVWQMASLKRLPPTKEFISNFLIDQNIIGDSEEIEGDVLLVVEQYNNEFKLPYGLMHNKPVRKPELFVEKSIEKAREVLENTNDIVSDNALFEFLQRKGLTKSSVWIFSALVKTKLSRQLLMSTILAEAIKRLVDKEIFIQSSIHGKEKIPSGILGESKSDAPTFQQTIMKVIKIITLSNAESDPKTFKNLLMILFFFRLESMQFFNSLQFEVGTKNYYQGKQILDDILQIPNENPLLFLKTVQNIGNVKFSFEFLRKVGIDKFSFIYNSEPFSVSHDVDDGEKVIYPGIKTTAPVTVRERMYFMMAKLISTQEYNEVVNEETESEDQESMNSRYSTPTSKTMKSSDYEGEESEHEENESFDPSYNSYESNESHGSSESMNKENSPPFKQAKYDRTDSKAIFNNVYSNRNSLSSNYENVLRASHANMNMNKNYIESDNHEKKLKYISKKVFLQLPSSLYRLKLSTIELDSFEASRISIRTKVVEHADFLQEFSILRQNYSLITLDQFNTLIFNIENALKDVYSLEGDESAFLEIILINNILLFISEKFDDIFKLMDKVRETMFTLFKCPLEIISVMQLFAGILFEKENIIESEKEYLMSIIHYFNIASDPRGRGSYSSNYLLGLSWKASMIAHYHKKLIDAELGEEILDAAIHNIVDSQETISDKKESKYKNKKGTKKSVRKTPVKRSKRASKHKINIDDIDIEMLSSFEPESGDAYDDLLYLVTESKYLFQHWNSQKNNVEDIEDYMKYGTGNQLDYFIWLLRCNPCMYMTGIKFTNQQIREFTFSDGVNNILNLKSASSIMSAIHNFSSSMSMDSFSSTLGMQSTKEKRQRAFHHGAYQHILNKDHYSMSRSEGNGVVYVWGTDTQGQLGGANLTNLNTKDDDSDEEFRRFYPRIGIGLKDLIIKEVCGGNEHSLAVTIEGDVWAWGNNSYTQLGIGKTEEDFTNKPQKVKNISDVVQVSGGYEHSAALTSKGELYTWGHGQGGLLGHGDLDNRSKPKLVEYFKDKKMKVGKICGGGLHNIAITENGDVYTWGRGEGLQLGLSKKTIEDLEDIEVGISIPTPIIKDKTIIDVAAGAAHSIALADNGRVYCWGHGNYGQLGLGISGESFEPGTGDAQSSVFEPVLNHNLKKLKIIRVYAGSTFSMFLSDNKELYACGINDIGQCGIDTAQEELKAFENIKDGKQKKVDTDLDINVPRKLEGFSMMSVESVAGGENHSFAIVGTDDNSKKMLWGWGMYKHGQLGLGEIKKRINPRPVQTLYNTNIQLDKVSCGSTNTMGILGDPNIFEIPDHRRNEGGKSNMKALENDIWNVIEHRNEENYDEEEMMEK